MKEKQEKSQNCENQGKHNNPYGFHINNHRSAFLRNHRTAPVQEGRHNPHRRISRFIYTVLGSSFIQPNRNSCGRGCFRNIRTPPQVWIRVLMEHRKREVPVYWRERQYLREDIHIAVGSLSHTGDKWCCHSWNAVIVPKILTDIKTAAKF